MGGAAAGWGHGFVGTRDPIDTSKAQGPTAGSKRRDGMGMERSWDEPKEREEAAGAEHTVRAGGAGLVPSPPVPLQCFGATKGGPLPHPKPHTASPSLPAHQAVEQQVAWQNTTFCHSLRDRKQENSKKKTHDIPQSSSVPPCSPVQPRGCWDPALPTTLPSCTCAAHLQGTPSTVCWQVKDALRKKKAWGRSRAPCTPVSKRCTQPALALPIRMLSAAPISACNIRNGLFSSCFSLSHTEREREKKKRKTKALKKCN